MLDTIKKESWAKLIVALFIFFTIWWILLQILPVPDIQKQIFSALYGSVALTGAVFGIHTSKKWGGWNSLMGRAIIMFSLGLFLQEFGQLVYSVYNFFIPTELPYPSLGDLGYFGSIPCYIYGVWLLGKVSGVKVRLQTVFSAIQAIIIPLVMLIIAYVLFLRDYTFDWSAPLSIFLDFGYPMGEAIYISLAILTYLLSRKVLGGIMRSKVLFILFALLVQFFSDYTFLYLAHYDTVIPGGLNDYMYLVAYFLMAISLIQLKTVSDTLRGDRK